MSCLLHKYIKSNVLTVYSFSGGRREFFHKIPTLSSWTQVLTTQHATSIMRMAGKNEIVREVMQNGERRGAATPFSSILVLACNGRNWHKKEPIHGMKRVGIYSVYGRLL